MMPPPCHFCRTYHPGICSRQLLAERRVRPWRPGPGGVRRCAICRKPLRDDYLVLRVPGRRGQPTAPFHRGCAQVFLAAEDALRDNDNVV